MTGLYLVVITDFASWNYFLGNCHCSSSVCIWQYSKKCFLAKNSVNLQLSSALGAKRNLPVGAVCGGIASCQSERGDNVLNIKTDNS